MTQRYFIIGIIAYCLAVGFAGAMAFPQKNEGNNRRDEQRENERVRNAEREVTQARKRLAELQNDLRTNLRRRDSIQEKIATCEQAIREAIESAESELGDKLGIPEALADFKQKRKIYESVCKPVLMELHQSPDWKKLEIEVAQAKATLKSVREEVELSEEERDQKTKTLNEIILQPQMVENQSLKANSECVSARLELDEASKLLKEVRKRLTDESVNKHRLVVTATKAFTDANNQLQSAERELVASRTSVLKAQRVLEKSIFELAKAKQADASDKNIRGKKN